MAIILGAAFAVIRISLIHAAAAERARAAAVQVKSTTEQLKQNSELANMDMIMRLNEFAETAEVQSAWLTILNAQISSYDDFQSLSKSERAAFFQIGALFECLCVLVERGIVKVDIIEDMFATQLAWRSMKAFVSGIRERYGDEENYASFEQLHNLLTYSNE